MKHYLSILVMIALCGPLFSQSVATVDYQSLMKAHRAEAEQLQKTGEAVAQAQRQYITTVETALTSEGITVDGPTRKDTKRRQEQVTWMTNVVPVLVSVTNDPQQAEENMALWVAGFCREFGLTDGNRQAMQRDLKAFRSAYGQYWSAYYQVQEMMSGSGSVPPPPPPPPPPPSQQHH